MNVIVTTESPIAATSTSSLLMLNRSDHLATDHLFESCWIPPIIQRRFWFIEGKEVVCFGRVESAAKASNFLLEEIYFILHRVLNFLILCSCLFFL